MTTWKAYVFVAIAVALLLLCGTTAPALADFDYNLTIATNAAGLNGTSGSLDIQFNPEEGTGVLTATVQTLAGNDTTVGGFSTLAAFSPTPIGNVTGSGLPLTFTADNINGPGMNEATLNVTFGPTQLALSVNITTADNFSTASLFITLYDSNLNLLSSIPGSAGQAIELDVVADPTGLTPPTINAFMGSGANATAAFAVAEPNLSVLLAQCLACLFVFGVVGRKWLAVTV
jgi:hypothetical protein